MQIIYQFFIIRNRDDISAHCNSMHFNLQVHLSLEVVLRINFIGVFFLIGSLTFRLDQGRPWL